MLLLFRELTHNPNLLILLPHSSPCLFFPHLSNSPSQSR
ncbi:hypothetical protein DVH24_042194 [Malus domestica]|uniref:Uncharacterized protein n=1 Tax=Malus domestica TaxID=3750 RepID=A0A498J2Q1_MALDO|nr:hypothetical protein DVH24_042194 [Malus domestica]